MLSLARAALHSKFAAAGILGGSLCALGCSDTEPTLDGVTSGGSAGVAGAGTGGNGGAGTGGSGGVAGTGGSGGSAGTADQCGASGGSAGSGPSCEAPRAGARIVGYLPTYRGPLANWAQNLDFSRLTHLMVAFAEPAADGTLSLPDQGPDDLSALVTAAHACHVKVSISLGGGATTTGAEILNLITPDKVEAFAQKILEFVKANELDGVDVDLEGQSVNEDYAGFVAALESVLKPEDKLLTAALGTWFADAVPAAALDKMDFISAMAYDKYGAWTDAGEHSPYDLAVSQLNFWSGERGVPAANVVLGVPFYGYYWGAEKKAMTYAEILGQHPDACTKDWIQGNGFQLSYNGVATIRRKAELSKTYGGIMVWELGQDAPGAASLLRVVSDTLAE